MGADRSGAVMVSAGQSPLPATIACVPPCARWHHPTLAGPTPGGHCHMCRRVASSRRGGFEAVRPRPAERRGRRQRRWRTSPRKALRGDRRRTGAAAIARARCSAKPCMRCGSAPIARATRTLPALAPPFFDPGRRAAMTPQSAPWNLRPAEDAHAVARPESHRHGCRSGHR
jgi:hypothetical protein